MADETRRDDLTIASIDETPDFATETMDGRNKREPSSGGDRSAGGRHSVGVQLIHNHPQHIHRLSQSPMCEIAWRDARTCGSSRTHWLIVYAKWSTILT